LVLFFKKEQVFFFEKKKQKTFAFEGLVWNTRTRLPGSTPEVVLASVRAGWIE
jgi:hypothetical protein